MILMLQFDLIFPFCSPVLIIFLWLIFFFWFFALCFDNISIFPHAIMLVSQKMRLYTFWIFSSSGVKTWRHWFNLVIFIFTIEECNFFFSYSYSSLFSREPVCFCYFTIWKFLGSSFLEISRNSWISL